MKNYYTNYHQRRLLTDVVIMRVILIFLLIGTHSFAPFGYGTWETIPQVGRLSLYGHFSIFFHFISLPSFVFISGYIFGHSWEKTKNQSFVNFIIKKVKRLILPSLIFSLFYYYFFYDKNAGYYYILRSVSDGCGHLWFLPMLFWCFIITYLLHRTKLSNSVIIPALVVVAILPVPVLPLRLSATFTYLIFFYLGSYIQLVGKSPFKFNAMYLLLSTILYVVLIYFLPLTKVTSQITVIKILELMTINAMRFLLGFLGISIAFVATRLFLANEKEVSENILLLSTYCFGIYVIHQFIIKYLYYYSSFNFLSVNSFGIPWLCYLITLISSVIIVFMLLKTKCGRYLLG